MTRSKWIKWRYFRRLRLKQLEKCFVTMAAFMAVAFLLVAIIRTVSNNSVLSPELSDVSAFRIPYESFRELELLSAKHGRPMAALLTLFSQEFMFFPDNGAVPCVSEIEQRYIFNFDRTKRRVSDENTALFKAMFNNLLSEMRVFPIPQDYAPDTYVFSDSWGAARTYGGDRIHKGTDILDKENTRGRLPIISMTDGRVFNHGWNDLGGFYVGIITKNGTYYYYAHLDSFAPGLTKDMPVKAGQLLGYMGDTGYGGVGSRGHFPVHLHVGISPIVTFTDDEFWINPYPFLRSLEEKRISARLARY